MSATVKFITDGAEMERVTRGTDGPVYADMLKRGDRLIALGLAQIEARRGRWNGSHRGKLQIRKRFGTDPRGLLLLVIASSFSSPDYAFWVHEGNGSVIQDVTGTATAGAVRTRIYPKNKRALAFVTDGDRPTGKAGWKAARAEGRAIVVRSVRSSEPNRFLTDNLELVTKL